MTFSVSTWERDREWDLISLQTHYTKQTFTFIAINEKGECVLLGGGVGMVYKCLCKHLIFGYTSHSECNSSRPTARADRRETSNLVFIKSW